MPIVRSQGELRKYHRHLQAGGNPAHPMAAMRRDDGAGALVQTKG